MTKILHFPPQPPPPAAPTPEALRAEFPGLAVTGSPHVRAAANLRRLLSARWPRTKFKVTSTHRSTSDQIDLRWVDGAAPNAVHEIADRFTLLRLDGATGGFSYRPDNAFTNLFGGVEYVIIHRQTSPAAELLLAEQIHARFSFDSAGRRLFCSTRDEELFFTALAALDMQTADAAVVREANAKRTAPHTAAPSPAAVAMSARAKEAMPNLTLEQAIRKLRNV